MQPHVIQFERRGNVDKHADWVELTNAGARKEDGSFTHATWHKVKSLMPPEDAANDPEKRFDRMVYVWSVVGPQYEAWKNDETPPDDGTPLNEWGGVNAAQMRELKKFGIRSVEELAGAPDVLVSKLAIPQPHEMQKSAKVWLESKESTDMARQIAELQAQNAEMLKMLAEKSEPKRGPGRPRKDGAA